MDLLEPALLALVAAVGFGIGFVKAAFGLGGGVIFVPLLAAVLDPRAALGVTAPLMLVGDVTTIKAYWRRWHWPTVRVLVPAALAGLAGGSVFVAAAGAAELRRAMALVAFGFVAVQVWRLVRGGSHLSPRPGASVGLASAYGVGGGLASMLAHSGGLVFAFYMLPRLDRAGFVASLALLLLVLDLVKIPVLLEVGALGGGEVLLGLLLAPVMLAGSLAGERFNGRLPERAFMVGVTVLVFATGLWLLVR